MNFGSELRALDCIGLPRFTPQQAKAIIDRVRKLGALVSEPPPCEGAGIIIGGGGKYLSWTYVLVRWLRLQLKTQLPIQVWHLGPKEMPGCSTKLFAHFDVETVDTHKVMLQHPVREMGGWILKAYAVRHCPWRNAIFTDADSFPQVPPEELLNDKDVQQHGSLFFHDVGRHNSDWGYVDCSLLPPDSKTTHEWESGQFIWDKQRAWMALRWTMWMQEHSDVFWHNQTGGHGDKFTTECGFRISENPHLMGDDTTWQGWGISHKFKGREVWRHMMATKRGEWPMEPWMRAAFEEWKSIKL